MVSATGAEEGITIEHDHESVTVSDEDAKRILDAADAILDIDNQLHEIEGDGARLRNQTRLTIEARDADVDVEAHTYYCCQPDILVDDGDESVFVEGRHVLMALRERILRVV